MRPNLAGKPESKIWIFVFQDIVDLPKNDWPELDINNPGKFFGKFRKK